MRIQVEQTRGGITQDLLDNTVVYHGVEYFQVHPTFAYEAFFNLLLMIALIIYRPHKKFNGEVILLYLLGYGVIRFFVESLRTDQLMFFNTGVPVSQLVSVLFVIASLALIILGRVWGTTPRKKGKR